MKFPPVQVKSKPEFSYRSFVNFKNSLGRHVVFQRASAVRMDRRALETGSLLFFSILVPRVFVPFDPRSGNERPWNVPIGPKISDFRLNCACLTAKNKDGVSSGAKITLSERFYRTASRWRSFRCLLLERDVLPVLPTVFGKFLSTK